MLASQETLAALALTDGPTGGAFSWGGTATTPATLASYATAWTAATYAVGDVRKTSAGGVYGCVVAGASAAEPTGTNAVIRVGTEPAVRWVYLGAPNARRITISNLAPSTMVYFGSSANITTSAALTTVGAPIPQSPGAWTLLGGDPSTLYIVGTTAFAVTVTT